MTRDDTCPFALPTTRLEGWSRSFVDENSTPITTTHYLPCLLIRGHDGPHRTLLEDGGPYVFDENVALRMRP